MKRKFKIYEKLGDDGILCYFVKQNFLWIFWIVSEYSPLVSGFYSPTAKNFYSIENARKALEEVRVIMGKKKKSYVKEIDTITIEV